MNILIAHPNNTFITSLRQMLHSQNRNYKIVGVNTLTELVEHVSRTSFDVLLFDSDFALLNKESFFQILQALISDSQVLFTVRNRKDELGRRAAELGIDRIIEKKSGYLLSLSSAVKKAAEQALAPAPTPQPTGHTLHRQPDLDGEKDGYFVCDRRGRFLSVNQALEKLSGYSNEELAQLSIVDLFADHQHENFIKELFDAALQNPGGEMNVQIQDKFGNRLPSQLQLRVLRDDARHGEIIGFRGTVRLVQSRTEQNIQKHHIDQTKMVAELSELVQLSYSEPLNIFLRRIAEVICQIFQFRRSTIALLDHRKQAFVKHAMVGYTEAEGRSIEQRALEVPREVIDRIFADRYRIKVIYYNESRGAERGDEPPAVPERRTQRRRPLNEWHKRDLVLLNLKDHRGNTFGYVSLDDPAKGIIPTRSTFYNLELFSRLVSMSIENFYRFNALDRKTRRLKQMLADSSIFKLHLSLTDLLNEMCWSARYTLEFNLVSLILISKKTQMLETRAVACDDKIKQTQIRELTFDVRTFSELLKDNYRVGKSYLVDEEEKLLDHLKQIYYGAERNLRYGEGWPNWAALLVPIKARDGKIIGFFLADDPNNCHMPSLETIQTLEILANQVAIAIDNRVMYVQAKEGLGPEMNQLEPHQTLLDVEQESSSYIEADEENGGFKKIVERFLR